MSNKNRIINKGKLCIVILIIISSNNALCEDLYRKKVKPSNLQSFFSGFCLLFISEILDRTFFLTMIYALTNSFSRTFIISSCTLISMNLAALILGNYMPLFFYEEFVDWIAFFVFLLFGSVLLYDGLNMKEGNAQEDFREVESEVKKQTHQKAIENKASDLEEHLLKEQEHNEIIDDPKFDTTWSFVISLILAECGDRSQITGIVIGAVYNFYGVLIGTSLGIIVCILLSIWSGNYLSQKISKRQIKILSGITFIAFSFSYLLQILGIL